MSDSVRFVVNVETAVYRDGRYLLAERAATEDHAAGALSLVGGTVERGEAGEDVLTSDASEGSSEPCSNGVLVATARRELREEVGVAVAETAHVTSGQFVADGGAPVVNIVLLGRHGVGEGEVRDPEEVASVGWFTPEAVADHEAVPSFTKGHVAAAEERRRALGW